MKGLVLNFLIFPVTIEGKYNECDRIITSLTTGIITDMRQALVSSRVVGLDKKQTLADIMATALADLVDQMKSVLQNLKVRNYVRFRVAGLLHEGMKLVFMTLFLTQYIFQLTLKHKKNSLNSTETVKLYKLQ